MSNAINNLENEYWNCLTEELTPTPDEELILRRDYEDWIEEPTYTEELVQDYEDWTPIDFEPIYYDWDDEESAPYEDDIEDDWDELEPTSDVFSPADKVL